MISVATIKLRRPRSIRSESHDFWQWRISGRSRDRCRDGVCMMNLDIILVIDDTVKVSVNVQDDRQSLSVVDHQELESVATSHDLVHQACISENKISLSYRLL